MFFLDIWILITPLVSSNSSYRNFTIEAFAYYRYFFKMT